MAKFDTNDIINYSIDGNSVKMRDAVNSIMAEKINQYLETRKVEVAQSIFSGEGK